MKKLNKAKMLKLIALILIIAILAIATIYMMPIIKQINTPEGQEEFKAKMNDYKVSLAEKFQIGHKLEKSILEQLEGLKYE